MQYSINKMPQQNTEALRDYVTVAPTTTVVTTPAEAATTQMHILPTALLCRTLLIPLVLCCLLPIVHCDLASATLLASEATPAPNFLLPHALQSMENDDRQAFMPPNGRVKRTPYTKASKLTDKSNTTPITDVDDDYYYEDEEVVEAGNGSENVSGRARRHQHLESPPARFGYDGSKIQPQQFYTPQMLVNEVGGSVSETHLAQPLKSPVAARVNNDLSIWSFMDDEKRTNICDVCSCSSISFVTIVCDYNQRNPGLSDIFGTNYRVPLTAISITIKLASNTHFRLEKDLFVNNSRMNSFTIVGSHRDGEQVEITTGAFPGGDGTIGPYPEILMQDVFSVVVREGAFAGNKKFTVRNSNDLILYSNAFKRAEINGRFVGVADLRIEEKAFNSANATLHIENSHIDNIYRFEASLREIKFSNCSIGTINSGSFDVNNINFIAFVNSRIDVIKSRAITEKLFSMHVSFIGGVIGYIEGEAIHGSGINELIFRNNRIDTIHENAIHVNAINATIADNRIKHLGPNWLRVKEWSNIVIEKNVFGDFGGIILEETKKPGICRFENNSLTVPQQGSLNITNRHCILREISVLLPCRCNRDWLTNLSDRDLRSEIYCTIDTKLGACFNATTFNMLKYENEVCDETKTTVDCGANRNLKKVDGKFFTLEELERQDSQLLYIIYLSVTIVLAVVAVIILVLVLRCLCRQKKGNSGGNLSQHHRHEFTEHEQQIIERTLQLVQKRYPNIHARVERLCQELLQTNRTEKQCIRTVTKIEDLLNKIERSEDLNDFCSVLAQHLQPQSQTLQHTPEVVYSTNSFVQVQHENYGGPLYAVQRIDTSHTIASMRERERDCEREREREREREQECANSAINGHNDETLNVPNEPFYEELGQPLLPDYASPQDHAATGLSGELEYAEPINNRADYAQRLPPYAPPKPTQSNSSRKLPAQPSTMVPTAAPRTHLPPSNNNNNIQHPLYQSHNKMIPTFTSSSNNNRNGGSSGEDKRPALPPSNVKRMAYELQNMPNFHLPNAARHPPNKHLVAPPVYTAPDISHKRPMPTPASTFARLATPEVDESEYDMRGAAALPPDTGSDHSGGSNETVKIDDVYILYADA
ncbi:uncharacterized protein LOC128858454 [Anastrepha ludens]|uniref:uncharacterized protein LOC128858454 n=1 Tax=Anastrepha ludens TaxID=28586 RepID=UPI0023B100F6|nr:uncharacterized protein LOC128858454 [Anastrepha ludens]